MVMRSPSAGDALETPISRPKTDHMSVRGASDDAYKRGERESLVEGSFLIQHSLPRI